MNTSYRIAAFFVLTLPACAFAGTPPVAVSEPGLLSLLAVGGIALALVGKFRKK
jgi:hypothetical protein